MNMKNLNNNQGNRLMKIKLLSLFIIIGILSACSHKNVPPASKGKWLGPSGYSPEILEPGRYKKWWFVDKRQLVILETNTDTYTEKVSIVLKDKLTLNADVRFRGRIAGSDEIINLMFNDVKAGKDKLVTFNEVYRVYGKMVVRNKAREIMSQYTVEDVHSNYARISKEIGSSLSEHLQKSPIELSDIALGKISYPDVVTKAINTAKERELAIKKEQAQAEIDLTKKKNERLLAEANYQIEITNAKAIRDKNKIIGEGVTEDLLKLRALEVQEAMAKNGSAVFMPYEAIGTSGAQVRMFQK